MTQPGGGILAPGEVVGHFNAVALPAKLVLDNNCLDAGCRRGYPYST